MRSLAILSTALFVGAILAGCSGSTPAPTTTTQPPVQRGIPAMTFAKPVTVDGARIASEPSIKVAKDGTIFVTAPTGTVKYATRPFDLPVMAGKGAFQSAIWSSRDNGTTWAFADTLGVLPYHSALPGGGDADLAIDAAGTIFMADQEGLANEAVSTSHDNGATWEAAGPLGSGVPDTDRMWLWPDPTTPGTVYMNYDMNGRQINVAKTTDDGKTWTAVFTPAASTAPGPIVATNQTVAFSYNNGAALEFVHSEDKGLTWKQDDLKDNGTAIQSGAIDLFPQTFADTKGTLYIAWLEAGTTANGTKGNAVAYIFSHDAGKTWSPKTVAFTLPGAAIFLWGTAGSSGRIGFSWYEAPKPAGAYYIHAGIVIDADTDEPMMVDARVQTMPARPDPPCTNGVGCTSGRELGDFQQCAITPDGTLVVSYVVVSGLNEAGQPNGGHITFARLAEGPKLLDGTDTFTPWRV
ncbi:MAG: sialidase family protein [bacterium]